MASKKGSGGGKRGTETAPLVEWVVPTSGETVHGTTNLSLKKNPVRKKDVIHLSVLINGPATTNYTQVSWNSAIPSYFWNTTDFVDGEYVLTAKATDNTGRTYSTSVTVKVSNAQG